MKIQGTLYSPQCFARRTSIPQTVGTGRMYHLAARETCLLKIGGSIKSFKKRAVLGLGDGTSPKQEGLGEKIN